MLSGQTPARVWNTRRTEKQRRLASVPVEGKVLPTDDLVAMLEKLIAPGDKVVLEGNNQKQADFLSRSLAQVSPQKVHDLHMIMPSVGRSEHLDIFEKGIARKLDFSFSGTQSLRISQLLEDGQLEIGAIHTYIELYSRLYVDLSPNVAPIAKVTSIPGRAPRIRQRWWKPPRSATVSSSRRSTSWWMMNVICLASIFPARGSITWW